MISYCIVYLMFKKKKLHSTPDSIFEVLTFSCVCFATFHAHYFIPLRFQDKFVLIYLHMVEGMTELLLSLVLFLFHYVDYFSQYWQYMFVNSVYINYVFLNKCVVI